jgi:hypothetical protein
LGLIVVVLDWGKRAVRGALKLLKRSARVGRGLVAQRGMWPDVIVVVAPKSQFASGIGQAVEDLLIQAFVAQAAVETLDKAILLRLARIDVVPLDTVLVGPFRFADLRFRIALLVNSVPLSETMQLGLP